MREILFRGKRRNGEWIYGYYCPKPFTRFPCEPAIVPSDIINIAWQAVRIDPETLGEFTGLTDKNGVKIFEGDIVEYRDYADTYIGTVYIGKYTTPSGKNIYGCYIQWQPPEDKYVRPDLYYWTDENEDSIEVIGNIYDNPELLEVKDNV